MDEITVTTTTRVSELSADGVRTYEFDPLPFIEAYADAGELTGGEPEQNAAIVRAVLGGERGAKRDIVCLNAAAAIVAGGKAATLGEGWEAAQAAIDGGGARRALEALVATSQG
jgi:anthranilate phosphoribosyltransferase